METSYQYRRDNEAARPPRTWAAQRNISPTTAESEQNRMLVATPIDQLAKRKDSPMRFQPVAKAERQKLAQRGQEVQKSRDQRRTLEAKAVDHDRPKTGRGIRAGQSATSQIPDCGQAGQSVGQETRLRPRRSRHPNPISSSSPNLKPPVASQTRTGAILNLNRASLSLKRRPSGCRNNLPRKSRPDMKRTSRTRRTKTRGTKATSNRLEVGHRPLTVRNK